MYNPYNFVKATKANIKLKIFYFSLEMSREEKLRQAISNKLYIDSSMNTRITPTQLRSIGQNDILNEEILKQVEGLDQYFDEFEKTVTFIDDVRNPFGIYRYMREYARKNGKQHRKKLNFENKNTDGSKNVEEVEVDDYYEPNDPDEYVIVIVDHARLIHPESGQTLRDAISKLSSDYFVTMRNKWGYIPVLIQQQAAGQEDIEHAKFDKLRPTLDGLGDCKTTQQDANLILGLYSPFRHQVSSYQKYNIQKFRDHIRFLEILGGREGGAGMISPLYFDGAVNYFRELPQPEDEVTLQKIYKRIEDLQKISLG